MWCLGKEKQNREFYLAVEKIPPLIEPMQDTATKIGKIHQIGPRTRWPKVLKKKNNI